MTAYVPTVTKNNLKFIVVKDFNLAILGIKANYPNAAMSDRHPLAYQSITPTNLKKYGLLERLFIAHCGRSSLYNSYAC